MRYILLIIVFVWMFVNPNAAYSQRAIPTPTGTQTKTRTFTKSVTQSRTATPSRSRTNTRIKSPTRTITPSRTPSLTKSKTSTPVTEAVSGQVTLFDKVRLTSGQVVSSMFIDVRNFSNLRVFLKGTNFPDSLGNVGYTNASCYFTPDGYTNSDRYGGEYILTSSTAIDPQRATMSQIIGPNLICDILTNSGGGAEISMIVYLQK